MGFIPEMKGWFNILKSIGIMYSINKLKNKTTQLSRYTKIMWQNSAPNHSPQKARKRRKISQPDKGWLWETYSFKPPEKRLIRNQIWRIPVTTSIQHCTKVLERAMRQWNGTKGIQISKEETADELTWKTHNSQFQNFQHGLSWWFSG